MNFPAPSRRTLKIALWTLPLWILPVLAIAMYLAAFFVNNVLYGIPRFDTLDLNGRKMLVAVAPDTQGNKLQLVEFKEGNEQAKTMIPGSQGLGASTAIMKDGTLLWSDTSDNQNYKIFKSFPPYTSSSLLTSIKLFDLASFAKDYQAGKVALTAEVQNRVSDLWRLPFIVDDEKGTIGFLDAMVTKGEGGKLTEAAVRYNNVSLVNLGVESLNLMFSNSYKNDFYVENRPAKFVYFKFKTQKGDKENMFHPVMKVENDYDGNVAGEWFYSFGDNQSGFDAGLTFSSPATITFGGKVFGPMGGNAYEGASSQLTCHLDTSDSCTLTEAGQSTGLFLDSEGSQVLVTGTQELFHLGYCNQGGFFISFTSIFCRPYLIHSARIHEVNGRSHTIMRFDTVEHEVMGHTTISLELLSEDKQLALIHMEGPSHNTSSPPRVNLITSIPLRQSQYIGLDGRVLYLK